MDGSNRGGCDDSALMVCDRNTLLPCVRRVSGLSNAIAPMVTTALVPYTGPVDACERINVLQR
jgi:hypothetical protein